MMLEQLEEVLDPCFFTDNNTDPEAHDNWVYEEMWEYFQKKHHFMTADQVSQRWSKSKIDLLEMYCGDSSQLTHQSESLGMTAIRFGLTRRLVNIRRPLQTVRCCLVCKTPAYLDVTLMWSMECMEPPACKSLKLEAQIRNDRKGERVHLLLCDAMFRLQDWRGDTFHAHLEEPRGSEMLAQTELRNLVCHAFRVQCDMCTAEGLRHLKSHEHLRKRTQVWTTSQILWRMLQQYQCIGNHSHDTIAGTCRTGNSGRMSVSKYLELYTALFSKRIGKAILCSCQVSEKTFGPRMAFLGVASSADDAPEPKRRRLSGKFHPERLYLNRISIITRGVARTSEKTVASSRSLCT